MPQASDELRAKWGDDQTATKYLTDRGWKLSEKHKWHWVKPTPDHVVTPDEDSALDYMCYEWDFGGIVDG